MDVSLLLVILLSSKFEAIGAQLKLIPATLTVLRGDEARFTCTALNSQWTVMVWMLNNRVEVTISKENGVFNSINPNVTAEKNPALQGDSWVLILKSTERHNEGEVTCDLQGIGAKSASLLVQVKGSVKVFGDDKLAFKGQTVLFECAAVGWHPRPNLQWQVNGKKTSEGDYNISSEESETNLSTVTSNLNVTAVVSSRVDCLASVSALPMPLKSSTHLTVVAEVVLEENDCTVPLAVTASLAVLLLLVLLCTCTVLCYSQRRQSKASPQEAIRFDASVFGIGSGAQVAGGKVNLGYSNEGTTGARITHPTTVPDVVSSSSLSLNQEAQTQLCLTEDSSQTVRRITTV